MRGSNNLNSELDMQSQQYDVVIIGGGILGLSTAMQLSQRYPSGKIAVVEKEPELASHQTGHNSGVIHSGIYYSPGSLKSKLCVEGNSLLYDFAEKNNVEYLNCGKLVVGHNDSDLEKLDNLLKVPALRLIPNSLALIIVSNNDKPYFFEAITSLSTVV